MHEYRNIMASLCSRSCSGKTKNITHSECVFAALGIQLAIRHIFICGLSGSTIFVYVTSLTARFKKKKSYSILDVLGFCTNHFLTISHSKKNCWRQDQK